MKTTFFYLFAAAAAISMVCASCGKDGGNTPKPPKEYNVYTAGYESANGVDNYLPKIWENGVARYTLGNYPGCVQALIVSGGDIYAGGYVVDGNISKAVVWKNGEVLYTLASVTFDEMADIVNYAEVRDLALYSGKLYAAVNIPDETTRKTIAKIFEGNKVIYSLSTSASQSSVNALCVTSGGVYAGGADYDDVNQGVIQVWKNGSAVPPALSANNSAAVSIAVSGNDVYVGGSEELAAAPFTPVTKVWKNGALLYTLGEGLHPSSFSDMAVSGSDVYACGSEYDATSKLHGKVWKNDQVLYTVPPTALYCSIRGVAVAGSDVYYAGTDAVTTRAKVWKNGDLLYTVGVPAGVSEIFAIVVAPK